MGLLRDPKPEDIDYRLVVDSAPALVLSARPDGYVDYFNHRWFEYLGVSLSELEGSGWTKFVHPDDLEEHMRRWRTAMSDGQPAVSQARARNASGEYRWMLHRTEPLRDDKGNVVRWFGTSIDIKELKRVQHELNQLKEQSAWSSFIRDTGANPQLSGTIVSSASAVPAAGSTLDLSIVKSGSTYTCQYGTEAPTTYTMELGAVDPAYVYAGLFTARQCQVEFSNINLTLTP